MEKEKTGKLLCMLCCTNYIQDKKNKKGGLSTLIRFKQFCKELECCLAEKKMRKNQRRQKQQKLRGDLNLAYGDLSICPECLKLICAAVEIKTGAKDLEQQVLDLQMQILELMSELDGRMGTFLTRMKRIESVVKGSDEQCLTAYLDENVTGELRGDAIQFRERIIEAVEDLRIYRKELTDKVYCDNLIRRKKKRLSNVTDQKTQTYICGEIQPAFIDGSQSFAKKRLKLKHAAQQTDAIYILENKEESPFESSATVKVEVDDAGDYYMEDVDACSFNEDSCQDFSSQNIKTENSSTESKPRRHCRTKAKRKRKSYLESSNDDSANEEDDDYYNADAAGAEESCSETGSNFSEDDFEMQKMQNCPKGKRVLFDDLDVSQMSKFKKKIVSAVMKRLEKRMESEEKIGQFNQEEEENDDTCNLPKISSGRDIRDSYLVQYNVESGKFTLNNIEIICNDATKTLQCSLCNYSTDSTTQRSLWKIHDHILGKHLDAYKCGICSSVKANFHTYTDHVAGHTRLTICDICGKGLRNNGSLKAHKWLHMSEDERADAIQRGVANPRESNIKRKMKPKSVPCNICGKFFRDEGEIRLHKQRMHTERERISCHACGKLLMNGKASIDYHEKYSCPAGEQKCGAEECPVCHRVYKTKSTLRTHMAVEHPSTPLDPICCEKCGRQFKTKSGLTTHLREVHSDARPFSCRGCGASFKTKPCCRRHERTCKSVNNETSSENVNLRRPCPTQSHQSTQQHDNGINVVTQESPVQENASSVFLNFPAFGFTPSFLGNESETN